MIYPQHTCYIILATVYTYYSPIGSSGTYSRFNRSVIIYSVGVKILYSDEISKLISSVTCNVGNDLWYSNSQYHPYWFSKTISSLEYLSPVFFFCCFQPLYPLPLIILNTNMKGSSCNYDCVLSWRKYSMKGHPMIYTEPLILGDTWHFQTFFSPWSGEIIFNIIN